MTATPEAIAAASLAQVHLAKVRATGEWICIKVQYPGLAALIDGLREETDVSLHAYVVLPEGTIDRAFFDEIQAAECARFPLTGSFGSKEDEGAWRNAGRCDR